MNTAEIILVIAAVCILAADIAVRLVIAPHNRDHLVEDLLDILHEPETTSETAVARQLHPSQSLGESLLRHFTQSSLSCRIVDALAASDSGMHEADIAAAVNAELTEKHRRPLPEAAVRKVVMILMGAHFVSLRHGLLSLTDLGRQLHRILADRRRMANAPLFAAS